MLAWSQERALEILGIVARLAFVDSRLSTGIRSRDSLEWVERNSICFATPSGIRWNNCWKIGSV